MGGCTITSKTKNQHYLKFFSLRWPLWALGPLRSKCFQKTLILASEANSALSHENEIKIVKITHSAAAAFFGFPIHLQLIFSWL